MRLRIAWWWCFASACSSVPFAPTTDANVHSDAIAIADGAFAATDSGYVRPDALSLPPADLAVTLPFGGPEATLDLDASAALGQLDVAFSIDGTGSYGGEIAELQTALTAYVIPGLRRQVADVAFAVARFEDAPFAPFGLPTDRMYVLFTGMTTDLTRVSGAVAQLNTPLGDGGDNPEAGIESLYQIAVGSGLAVGGQTLAAPWPGIAATGGGVAPGVGFRSGAFRVIVHATDAPSHDSSDYGAIVPGTHSRAEMLAALAAGRIRVIGIASSPDARPDLEQFARSTGATMPASAGRCPTGVSGGLRAAGSDGLCPLVYDIEPNGIGLSAAIVLAIGNVTNALTYAMVWGQADDDRLGFVQSIEALSATVATGITPPTRADLRPAGDGVLDTFISVHSGTSLTLRAHLANRTVEPADYDQVFRVRIHVLGDGLELVTREVRITVPRGRLDAGGTDAGATSTDAALDAGGG